MFTTRGPTFRRNLGKKTIIFTMSYHNNYLFNENNQSTYRFKRMKTFKLSVIRLKLSVYLLKLAAYVYIMYNIKYNLLNPDFKIYFPGFQMIYFIWVSHLFRKRYQLYYDYTDYNRMWFTSLTFKAKDQMWQ